MKYKIDVLVCSNCGKRSNSIERDPHAWDGWTMAPAKYTTCPDCNAVPNGEKKDDEKPETKS